MESALSFVSSPTDAKSCVPLSYRRHPHRGGASHNRITANEHSVTTT
jgi:hypothetical protein